MSHDAGKSIPGVPELYRQISKNRLQKNTAFVDELWYSRYVGRRVSILFTWCFLHMGLSPNAVTLIALFFAVLGGAFLSVPTISALFASFLCFQLYIIIDSSDGEVARFTNRKTLLGKYLDDIVHVFAYASLYLGMGANAWARSGNERCLQLGLLAGLLFNMASFIYHLDPLLKQVSYLEKREGERRLDRLANNVYNIATGDIEISIALLFLAPLLYRGVIRVDVFVVILWVNVVLFLAGGIVYSLVRKFGDPRYGPGS